MQSSVKINGWETSNPFLVAVACCIALAAIVILMVIPMALLSTIIVLFLLTIAPHFMLRWCGRKGFYRRESNGHSWVISAEAFERR